MKIHDIHSVSTEIKLRNEFCCSMLFQSTRIRDLRRYKMMACRSGTEVDGDSRYKSSVVLNSVAGDAVVNICCISWSGIQFAPHVPYRAHLSV